jgi:hypothetical protein
MQDDTPKPEMSRHEASWHEHLAGMRAAEAARKQGGDPEVITAIASATAGPLQIGPHTLRPASQGTIWTLQRVAREWQAYADARAIPASGDAQNPGTREMLELGLATLAFCDARETWRTLDRGELETLIARAEELMWETPADVQLALQAHFTREMERIGRLAPAEDTPAKKPHPAPEMPTGSSPAAPIPAAATASPPANGWPQNTA